MTEKQFDSELHPWTEVDVLYAMFILKANKATYSEYRSIVENFDDRFICDYTFYHYADLFSDRAICGPEYEGWVDASIEPWKDSLSAFGIWERKDHDDDRKVKFRFVEGE